MDQDALNTLLKNFKGKHTVKLDDVIQSTLAQTLFNSFLLEQTLKTQLQIKAMIQGQTFEESGKQEKMQEVNRRAEENTTKSVHELMIAVDLDNNPGQ